MYKGRSKHNGEWWEGYYIYSSYEDKHFIVQNAVKSINNDKTGGFSFAHFTEVYPDTVEYIGVPTSLQ